MVDPGGQHYGREWRVQRFCRDLYERIGARIVVVYIFVSLGIATLTGVAMAVVGALYLDLDAGQIAAILAFGIPFQLASAGGALWVSRDILRTSLSWTGDGRTAERAPIVWNNQVRLPYLLCVRGGIGATIVFFPITAFIVATADVATWAFIPLFAALLTGTYACGLLVWFGADLFSRPLMEDVASHLPADFVPEHRLYRLRTKMLLPLPGVTLFSGLTVGALYSVDTTAEGRVMIALVISLGMALVASIIFVIISRSVLDPVDHLLDATRRVRAGQPPGRVPVVTADDLGELAGSFNGMISDLQESRARIVAASDDGRRKVERDLHDGAQQQLVMAKLKLGWARGMLDTQPDKAEEILSQLAGDIDTALEQLRDLAHGIYPAVLENEGLSAALREAAGRTAIPTTAAMNGGSRYPRDIEAAVYFCCLEALQNASKYAGQGARATMQLSEHEGALTFSVADDGQGFPVNGTRSRRGLQNMADRMGALGGTLDVRSAPGAGTTVSGRVPLAPR